MSKIFKYIGLSTILLFSFYYTEKISNVVSNNNKLMIVINDNRNKYMVKAVNAEINGDYIIPGLNGYAVNVLKSYDNMKYLDSFNEYYLEYDIIKPAITISNNKEKIIKYGNNGKKSISIIVKNNKEIIDFSKDNNINITRIVDINTFDNNSEFEQINGDYENYKRLDLLLNKYNINNNICIITDNNIKEKCMESKKILAEPSIILNSYNISNIKNNIKSGFIIYIDDKVSLVDFKILIKQIIYKDLKIIRLSKLISEERD